MASSGSVKPTILAFHGSGSNATIHTVQLARLGRLLKPHFNIESMEAPFPSAAGPGVLPFFEGCGPYKRWIPPTEKLTIASMKSGEASPILPSAVESLIRTTIQSVTERGSRIAGIIGFSQGTRVVAGLLKGAEIAARLRNEEGVSKDVLEGLDWLNFPFAVSVCGSYPPPLIPTRASEALAKSGVAAEAQTALVEAQIEIPTFHVQGLADEWAWAGKLLIEQSYEVQEGKSVVLEADMGHHYPAKPEESEQLFAWIMDVYRKSLEV